MYFRSIVALNLACFWIIVRIVHCQTGSPSLLIVGEWRHNHITSQITGLEAYIKSIAQDVSIKTYTSRDADGGMGYAIFSNNKLIIQWMLGKRKSEIGETTQFKHFPLTFPTKWATVIGSIVSAEIDTTAYERYNDNILIFRFAAYNNHENNGIWYTYNHVSGSRDCYARFVAIGW